MPDASASLALLTPLYDTLQRAVCLALTGEAEPQTLLRLAEQMKFAIEAGGGRVLFAYFAIYTLLTALCLPGGSVLMLVGGACMGFTECLFLSNAACTLGAWFTFMAARVGLRNSRSEARWIKMVEHRLANNQIPFLLSIRLAPIIPFAVFNILAGLSDLRSRRFVWTSFIGMLPGTWLYVNAGAQLGEVTSARDLLGWDVMASVAALGVLPWLIHLVVKRWTAN